MLTFACGYLAGLTTAAILAVLYWLIVPAPAPPEPPPRVGIEDNPLTRRWTR